MCIRDRSSWAPDPSSVPEAGVFAFAGDCARHDHPVDSRSGRAASRHRPTVVLSRTRLTLHAVPQRVLELLRLTDLQAVFGVIDESATISNTADVALGLGAPDGDHLLAQGAALSAEGSLELLELEEQVAGRRATASGRSRIDQARGLVMATRGCDAETAWRVLFLASREQDVQVHDLADALVTAAAGRDTGQSGGAMMLAVQAAMGAEPGSLEELTASPQPEARQAR